MTLSEEYMKPQLAALIRKDFPTSALTGANTTSVHQARIINQHEPSYHFRGQILNEYSKHSWEQKYLQPDKTALWGCPIDHLLISIYSFLLPKRLFYQIWCMSQTLNITNFVLFNNNLTSQGTSQRYVDLEWCWKLERWKDWVQIQLPNVFTSFYSTNFSKYGYNTTKSSSLSLPLCCYVVMMKVLSVVLPHCRTTYLILLKPNLL